MEAKVSPKEMFEGAFWWDGVFIEGSSWFTCPYSQRWRTKEDAIKAAKRYATMEGMYFARQMRFVPKDDKPNEMTAVCVGMFQPAFGIE